MARYAVVIPAAGQSRRFNAENGSCANARRKPFVTLRRRPVWIHSAERFALRPDVVQTIVVVSPDYYEEFCEEYQREIELYSLTVVAGGAERFLSVQNALSAVCEEAEYVAVHDAARPCATSFDVDRVFAESARTGAAILASRVVGSLKRSCVSTEDGTSRAFVAGSTSREGLWEAQTPQVFEKSLLLRAYRERPQEFLPTDDCGLVEALGERVSIVEGSRYNIKITSPEDLQIAEAFMTIALREEEAYRKARLENSAEGEA